MEYVAVLLGACVLMFTLLEIGLSIEKPTLVENGYLDLMDFIKLGFIFMSLAMGFLVVYLMMAVGSENNASEGFMKATSIALYAWSTIFVASISGIFIYYAWWVPTKMSKLVKEKKKREEEDTY